MIKKLQRKFIAIAMGSFLLVMIIIIGSINLTNLYQIDKRINNISTILSENNGQFPRFEKGKLNYKGYDVEFKITPETQFETRYFTVNVDKHNSVTKVDTEHISISSSEAQKYAENVLKTNKTKGYMDSYKYLITEKPYGSLIVFVDWSSQLHIGISFLIVSCGIAGISLLLVFILIYFLSQQVIDPIIESMEKQKQFITDAGHELKTPLAIISANTDILEIHSGKSEWIDSMRNQTKRLNNLIKNLLTLSKLEEEQTNMKLSKFSLSNIVLDVAMPFDVMAKSKGENFEVEIEPNLNIYGDESGIRQLVSILVDNAVKYSSEGGDVKVTLLKSNRNIRLEVCNTVSEVPKGDLNRLFDRFYRADLSRARETGGYGIGLSVAKAVVQAHRGKISVDIKKDNIICFTVLLNTYNYIL